MVESKVEGSVRIARLDMQIGFSPHSHITLIAVGLAVPRCRTTLSTTSPTPFSQLGD